MVLIAMGIALYFGRTHLWELGNELRSITLEPTRGNILIYIVLSGAAGLVALQIATMPMMENDALEYMAVARHIYESRSLAVYPVLHSSAEGLFAPSSHPPAYHMYIVWGYVWLGTFNFAPARLLAFYNLAGMFALLSCALWNHSQRVKCMAFLLLLSVPLYVSMLVGYHIDPLRLVAFSASAIAVAQIIDRPNYSQAVLSGVILGLAAFAHSIGVLAWVFGGISWLMLGPADRFRNLKIPLIICAVAVVVGGAQFAKNMAIYGVPLQDSAPVWEMPELEFTKDLKYRRDLIEPFDRLILGVFRGLAEFPLFGLSFWLMLPAFYLIWKERRLATTFQLVAMLWISLYFAVAGSTALMGSDLVIKNARYVMTLSPLAVALAAPLVASLQPVTFLQNVGYAIFLVVLPSWVLFQSVIRTANYGARLDLALSGERAPIYRANNRFVGAPLYRYIEQNLRPGEKTLVFRQSDFTLYGTGPWLDNFDTALIPFYKLSSVEDAYGWLQAHSVRYALVPDYTFPTFYRTVAGRLLGDNRFVEHVGTHRGYRLFRLRDAQAPDGCASLPRGAVPLLPWRKVRSSAGILGEVAGLPFLGSTDYRPLGRWAGGDREQFDGVRLHVSAPYQSGISIQTGEGPIGFAPYEKWARISKKGGGIGLEFDAVGQGMIGVDVIEYNAHRIPNVTRLWDGIVSERPVHVALQFAPQHSTVALRLAVHKIGRAPLHADLRNVNICRYPSEEREDQHPQTMDVVRTWSADQFSVDCQTGGTGECSTSSKGLFVRQWVDNDVQIIGEHVRLTTSGFRAGWRWRVRSWLETVRLFNEAHPDATIVQLVEPLLGRFLRPHSSAPLVRYALYFDGQGDGKYGAYVQYSTSRGSLDWRYVGSFFLASSRQAVRLEFELPSDAREPALMLQGDAFKASFGEFNLLRAAAAD
ncbi:MAG: hypothetical protein AB7E81_03500 [Hyphomicrobiaceae bacterium]